MSSLPQPVSRNQALDLLRGIAIIMVVLHHVEAHTIPGLPTLTGGVGYVFWRLRSFGVTGVDLFFVLSGFLVGGLLIGELLRTGKLRLVRFWLRRGLKIWPSYFALLAVLAITGASKWLDLSSPTAALRGLLVHGLFLQNYLDQFTNTPTWSLAVEEHFYLLLPCLLLCLVRFASLSKVGWMVGVVMLVCLGCRIGHMVWGHQDNDFMLSHNRFDSLLVGVGLAWAWRCFPDQVRRLTVNGWAVAAVVTLLVAPGLFYSRKDGVFFTLGFSMLALGYGLLLLRLVAYGGGWLGASLVGRELARVGRWSYNIYLWHFFLPLLLGPWYAQLQLGLAGAIGQPVLVVAAQSLVYVLLSVGAGWLFTMLVEDPALKWRDKWLASPAVAVPVYVTTQK